MPRMKRTLTGRMIIPGLDDLNVIRMEYSRYALRLDKQLARPETDASRNGGAVEARFVTDEKYMPHAPKRTAWIWCKSQYAAAQLVYGATDQKSKSRISRLVDEGDYRDFRVNQWIVRGARNTIPPAHRGWALFRKYVHTMRIYQFWVKSTYAPTAKAHKRRRDDFDNGETVYTRYVGM